MRKDVSTVATQFSTPRALGHGVFEGMEGNIICDVLVCCFIMVTTKKHLIEKNEVALDFVQLNKFLGRNEFSNNSLRVYL